VATFRERLVMSKQRSHIFHMERKNLEYLNDVEGKEKCYIEVSALQI
jgi:hypothetical protein